jgi:hypothetical protein
MNSVLQRVEIMEMDTVMETANRLMASTKPVTPAAYVIPSVIRRWPVTHMDLEHVKEHVSSLVIC